jgi:hypothetical protein
MSLARTDRCSNRPHSLVVFDAVRPVGKGRRSPGARVGGHCATDWRSTDWTAAQATRDARRAHGVTGRVPRSLRRNRVRGPDHLAHVPTSDVHGARERESGRAGAGCDGRVHRSRSGRAGSAVHDHVPGRLGVAAERVERPEHHAVFQLVVGLSDQGRDVRARVDCESGDGDDRSHGATEYAGDEDRDGGARNDRYRE